MSAFDLIKGLTRYNDHLFGMEPNRRRSQFMGAGYDRRSDYPSLSMDVHEDRNEIAVDCDVPGMRPEDIEVTVDDDVVTVRGTRRTREDRTEAGYRYRERFDGTFARSFPIPRDVNADEIRADIDHGTLTIRMPRNGHGSSKRIDVRSSS